MSPWYWALPAVLVFWSVGAYNRLVRLRGAARVAFEAVDRAGQRFQALLDAPLPSADDARTAGERAGLRGALMQLDAALRVARREVLSAPAIAVLQSAHTTLRVWEVRLSEASGPGPALDDWRARWTEAVRQSDEASAGFNEAVQTYNEAIRQFPAVLLALLFGFRAGGLL